MNNIYQAPKAVDANPIPAISPKIGGALSQALVLIFIFAIISDISSLFVGFKYSILLFDANAGKAVSDSEYTNIEDLFSLAIVFQSIMVILCSIVFIIWFHRAYKNLIAFGLERLSYSPGWSIGYWFIPIVNLFRPYQVAKEIWQRCAPEKEIKLLGENFTEVSNIVSWWWAFFLFSTITGRVSNKLMERSEDIDSFLTALNISMIADFLFIIGAVFAISFVKALDQRQLDKQNELVNNSEPRMVS
ncbi:DUF4328 domain-containing protein [Pleionea sediminis]|uniref:DUF4328 domain-containing protein n=1 Tax=Pleionea sediminis TaxID=2569479 RepID=UPI0011859362|nr:DUF4328 domain-containing protein [Pleionea sediminis]